MVTIDSTVLSFPAIEKRAREIRDILNRSLVKKSEALIDSDVKVSPNNRKIAVRLIDACAYAHTLWSVPRLVTLWWWWVPL